MPIKRSEAKTRAAGSRGRSNTRRINVVVDVTRMNGGYVAMVCIRRPQSMLGISRCVTPRETSRTPTNATRRALEKLAKHGLQPTFRRIRKPRR